MHEYDEVLAGEAMAGHGVEEAREGLLHAGAVLDQGDVHEGEFVGEPGETGAPVPVGVSDPDAAAPGHGKEN